MSRGCYPSRWRISAPQPEVRHDVRPVGREECDGRRSFAYDVFLVKGKR